MPQRDAGARTAFFCPFDWRLGLKNAADQTTQHRTSSTSATTCNMLAIISLLLLQCLEKLADYGTSPDRAPALGVQQLY